MRVAFVCDTGSGLTPNELEEFGVYGVPLQITEGNTTKLEGVEISVDEVYAKMQEGKMLKTSLASTQRCEWLFNRLKEEGYEMIFAIPICAGLSGTINMMRLCAERLDLQFDYYDCQVTAMVERYMCIHAKELYDQGKSIGEIKMLLSEIVDSANTLLIPDDLQHLKRGGRLTPMAAAFGGLLKIKPILQIGKMTNGKIDVLDKVRTTSKAMSKTVEIMKKDIKDKGNGYSITIAHVLAQEQAKKLQELYEHEFPDAEYHFIKLVSVVGIHTGIGCLATQYFKKL